MVETIVGPRDIKIKAIGVGGGGCNAIRQMVGKIPEVELTAVNTDVRSLELVPREVTQIQIGEKLTGGLGVGGDPVLGRKAAEESREQLREAVSGADIVFIAAGMGGGTGTGAAPIIAELAKQDGALTIGIVTRPFAFEGEQRRRLAEEGIANLIEKVDTVIVIPNERLLSHPEYNSEWSVTEAFAKVNEVLHRGIRAITKIITLPGMVNLDLSDIRAVMKDGGAAVLAIGSGSGPRRAEEAARRAIYSHFLGFPVAGARRVLVNVVGQERLALREVSEAVELVRKSVDPQANIRFGVGEERTLEEEVEVTLIATGFISRTFILTLTAEETRPLVKPVEPVRRLEPVSPMEELDIPTFIRRAIPLRGQYSVGHSADPSLESGERGGKRKGVSRPRPESPEGEAPEL